MGKFGTKGHLAIFKRYRDEELAYRMGYAAATVQRIRLGMLPLMPRFMRTASVVLGVPEAELFSPVDDEAAWNQKGARDERSDDAVGAGEER